MIPFVSESKLPQGEPAGRGISLDPSIPGSSTYDKPEGDVREFDKANPGPIYRKDGPDDRAKPQDDPEGDQRDLTNFQVQIVPPGGRPKDDVAIPKAPYRDGRPNQHMATVDPEFVLGCFLLKTAREASLPPNWMGPMGMVAPEREEIRACAVFPKREDVGNRRWLFLVNCGNGFHVVRLKVHCVGGKGSKFDLKIACSCPAWQAPEHHARARSYVDAKSRGTVTTPVGNVLGGTQTLCKHAAAVLARTKWVDFRGEERRSDAYLCYQV